MEQDLQGELEETLMLTTAEAVRVRSACQELPSHLPVDLSWAAARAKMWRGAWTSVWLLARLRREQLGFQHVSCRTAATSPLLSAAAALVSCA